MLKLENTQSMHIELEENNTRPYIDYLVYEIEDGICSQILSFGKFVKALRLSWALNWDYGPYWALNM